MCGISGIFLNKKNQKNLEEAIRKMNASQKNRGPDDEGIFSDSKNGIFLGHRRLSIIDLSSAGHQPMGFNNIWITYNGEIYNFLELKKDLEAKGHKFKTQTDTEVILALYQEYEEAAFLKLRGMFAFGLWDNRRKKLFLVKDRYGIKPLYYYSDSEKIVFASTVKTLESSEIISVQKNSDAYIGFLLFGSVPLPMTTIKNIFAVPTGYYLVCEADGNQKLVQYYDPLEFYQHQSTKININQCVEETRNLLENSVRHHLVSDAPLGVFLSGGLDSSAIAALAAKSLENQHQSAKISANQRLKTLSIVFDEKEFSEEYYSDLVAKKIKSDHRKIKITKQDFYDSFDEIFEAMDQPTIDGVNTFFIAKAAKQAGLKTVLSGLGADEIFLGYSHFKKAEILRRIQKLPKLLKSPLKLSSLFGDKYSKLSYFFDNDILSFYLGIRGLFASQEVAKILDVNESEIKDFIINMGTSDAPKISDVQKLDPANLLSYLELKFYLQNQLLKDTDSMSMHHSVEVRVPFLDHQLVEYLSGLPSQIKLDPIKNSRLKPLLAAAVSDLLPQEVFNRGKMGFTFPFQKWFSESSLITNYPVCADTSVGRQLPINKTHWSRFWAAIVLSKWQ